MLDTPASCRYVSQSVCSRESPQCGSVLTDGLVVVSSLGATDAPYCEVDRARSLRAVLHIHLSILHQQLAESVFLGASHVRGALPSGPTRP